MTCQMPLELNVFKKMSQEERDAYGKTLSYGQHKYRDMITFKNDNDDWNVRVYNKNYDIICMYNSSGYWEEYTRDEFGRVLSYADGFGYWYKSTYDKNGRELTFKDSYEVDVVNFFWGTVHALGYDKNTKKYHAGCSSATYEDAEEFYRSYQDVYSDSHDIIRAIRKHHEALTESEKSV